MLAANEATGDFSNDPIILNASLDASPINDIQIQEYIAREVQDLFKDRPSFEPIESTIRCEPGRSFVHNNYMHYLTMAWNNHLSVVISPDIVFYTILCEIASSVKADPETYRHLFTTSTEKIEIITLSHAPNVIDLNQLIEGIAQNSPIDSSLFTAEFSSTTIESRLALQAAFCDAMSPYFHYCRTACGIPRVKVLGTKQDWQSLERKIHSLATEVFAQDISTEKSLSNYLSVAETVVRRIHSTRDQKFWENMFAIGGCFSGHTAMVVGWITLLYRNGNGTVDDRCHGNDYYNYESHISTVYWQCLETGKEFELRTGLLYSVINDQGEEELDKKFPWFEPQFGHVVLDKNYKMTAEQFQNYINTELKGADKTLWQTFFELLKDDPMMVDKGPGELKQRLEIAKRQMDLWKKNCKDLQFDELVLEDDSDFGYLLSNYYVEDKDGPLIDKFIGTLVEFLQTMEIPKIVMATSGVCAGANQEHRLLQALIGNEIVETLTVSCGAYEDGESAMNTLCDVLAHPKCRIRTLNVTGHRLRRVDMVALGNALMKTSAPIEHLTVTSADVMELADAIYLFATQKNLKLCSVTYLNNYFYGEEAMTEIEVAKRIYSAFRDSRSLEEVTIAHFGDLAFSNKSQPVDVSELFAEVAAGLKLNSNLKSLKIQKWQYSLDLLPEMLSVPSLRKITFEDCPDVIPLDFLDITKDLESLSGNFAFDAEMVEKLSTFIADPVCKLNNLSIKYSKFTAEEMLLTNLTKSFVDNKSLTSLHIDSLRYNESDKHFIENITAAIKNGMPIQRLNIDYLFKDPLDMEKLLIAMASSTTTLCEFKCNLPIVSEAGFNAVLQIIQQNTSLVTFEVEYYGWGKENRLKLTEEQISQLRDAAGALPSVQRLGVMGYHKENKFRLDE